MKIAPSIAYHEAGHAAVAVYFRIGLKRVSVVPDPNYDGICSQVQQTWFEKLDREDSDSITKKAERQMMVALAGPEAQRKFAPTSIRRHQARGDIKAVFECAFSICGSAEEASALVELLRIRTRNLLGMPFVWKGVKALAKQLLKRNEISGKHAKAIIESADKPRDRIRIVHYRHSVVSPALPTSPVSGAAV